ncbi:MAG: hypothetical protein NTW87_22670 [Planctomycetota bacterium]|nr:hypothetical protein [Planctomycetota bacterium]
MRRARAPVALALTLLLFNLLAAEPNAAAGGTGSSLFEVNLAIPDTGQEAQAPAGGWCGEAAIQMACLYYGSYIPQSVINKAGSPRHPDLYAHELGKAIEGAGFSYEPWNQRDVKGDPLSAFIRWVRTNLAAGRPVVVGAKLYPTQHPEWGCDHFMLAVGAKARSLVFNTTWQRREELTHEQLSATEKGLSFQNPYKVYFALAVTGRRSATPNARPVSVRMDPERKDGVVKCSLHIADLEKGRKYTLIKVGDPGGLEKNANRGGNGVETETFVAQSVSVEIAKTIPADKPAVFHCVPQSEAGGN